MAIAVSNFNNIQVVNSSIAVYTRNGALLSGYPKSLSAFFPGSTGDLGDPRAFYDPYNKRFVVTADDFTGGRIYLAASKSIDPTAGWNIYSFAPWGAANCRASGNACPDFPQVGFDDTTIYIGVNYFNSSGAVSDWMLLLPKSNIYAAQSFGYNLWNNLSWGGVLIDTLHPSVPMTGSEHPRAGFSVASYNINFGGGQCRSGCNGIMVWAFSNNLQVAGSPGAEFSAVRVPTATTYSLPANANQPGRANSVDTGDVRISGTPTFHAGTITASLNTNGSDSHSHALWFQARAYLNDSDPRCTGAFAGFCPQVTTANLVNEDCYICGGQGTNGSTYYGALASNEAGDLAMVFDYSDDNTYPESAYVTRRATQAQNTMHDNGLVMCGGRGLYTQGRWGDYNAAVGDVSGVYQDYFWYSAQNSLSNGNWGTCVGHLSFYGINQQ